jgi:hypothetical protein
MGTTLSIIAVVVLLVLLVVSVKRQLAERAAHKQAVARAHTGEAEEQHAESLRRRANVRAVHAEGARAKDSDTDVQRVDSVADE